jgi:hypothetical protein
MTTVRNRLDTLRIAVLAPIALLVAINTCAAAADLAAMPATAGSSQQGASPPKPAPASSSLTAQYGLRLNVSFKLDPRLRGGTYGGERWVSPPTFSSVVQEGKEATVDAIVKGLDGRGAPVRIDPNWTATDPSMVIVAPVSPGQNDHVQITVKHAGETTLTIVALGISKELRIKATSDASSGGLQVTITQ